MIIPLEALDDDVLQGLLEEYASRDGTDYGDHEVPLQSKVDQLKVQLKQKKLVIWYDEKTVSTNLVPAHQALSADDGVL